MKGIFQRLFGRHAEQHSTSSPVSDLAPATVGASAVEDGQEVQREYEEFCRTFYFRPGERFMDHLAAEGVHQLRHWFHPGTAEPEPKAFIRLANDATRRGVKVWEQTGLEMYLHGRWSQGGGPSQVSQDGLSVLSQILGMPIKIYYRPAEDAEMMVMEFEP